MKKAMSHANHYKQLLIMGILSFVSMYILMYSMVNSFNNVYPNINQFYMAGLMTMPMLVIELIVMRHMYMNKKLNGIIMGCCSISLIVFFMCIQNQAGVGDKQFLKSMIPHHAAAVLMVQETTLSDPEIKELARNIIVSQQQEIEQMKNKLKELDK